VYCQQFIFSKNNKPSIQRENSSQCTKHPHFQTFIYPWMWNNPSSGFRVLKILKVGPTGTPPLVRHHWTNPNEWEEFCVRKFFGWLRNFPNSSQMNSTTTTALPSLWELKKWQQILTATAETRTHCVLCVCGWEWGQRFKTINQTKDREKPGISLKN
jgi:hypothetical protein